MYTCKYSCDFSYFLKIILEIFLNSHSVIGLPQIDSTEQMTSEFYSPHLFTDQYELYIEAQLYQTGLPLGLPVTSKYKLFNDFSQW